jgi:hypothetical protein
MDWLDWLIRSVSGQVDETAALVLKLPLRYPPV